jgi:hypothetical protein
MTMEFFRANSALIAMIGALIIAGVFDHSYKTRWSPERIGGYNDGLMTAVIIALGMMAIDGLKRLF